MARGEDYRELGEAAWVWVMSQVRGSDGPWLPEAVPADGRTAGPGAGRDSLYGAYPTHLAGVREHVMDHLADLDLAAFAEAMSGIAAAEMGPPVRRAPSASPA